ncbi:hypothetical protein JTE90_011655 [Oedothorax gibbosus]|uniref:Guanine nucleotide exchange factor MSS4 n=1 Tax=Oedothorax gibbosus TaxID=931172 RepID=A0AAV6U3D5_9ARAC|nr:hypothetical protein JTE90_011655 [Oedothorax gibbosus]
MAEIVESVSEDLSLPSDKSSTTEDMALNSELTIEGKNSKEIKCHRCPSIILAISAATLVTHKFKLPDPQLKEDKEKTTTDDTTTTTEYWCVDNMYAFENVGFSHNVDGVKYLICADCEIGPIGFYDLDTKLSYISLSKITYC